MAKTRTREPRPYRIINPVALTGQEAKDALTSVIHKMTPTRYNAYVDALLEAAPATM